MVTARAVDECTSMECALHLRKDAPVSREVEFGCQHGRLNWQLTDHQICFTIDFLCPQMVSFLDFT